MYDWEGPGGQLLECWWCSVSLAGASWWGVDLVNIYWVIHLCCVCFLNVYSILIFRFIKQQTHIQIMLFLCSKPFNDIHFISGNSQNPYNNQFCRFWPLLLRLHLPLHSPLLAGLQCYWPPCSSLKMQACSCFWVFALIPVPPDIHVFNFYTFSFCSTFSFLWGLSWLSTLTLALPVLLSCPIVYSICQLETYIHAINSLSRQEILSHKWLEHCLAYSKHWIPICWIMNGFENKNVVGSYWHSPNNPHPLVFMSLNTPLSESWT